MLLKKILLLKNRAKSFIKYVEDIEKKFELKISSFEKEINILKKENLNKDSKIQDLNKKISSQEKEMQLMSNDFITITAVITELYGSINDLVNHIEVNNLENIDEIDLEKKKKIYH